MKSEIFLPDDYRPAEGEHFMNDRQLEYFRRKLLVWKQELLGQSAETIDNLQDSGRNVPDIADRAIATILKALEVLSIFPHSCRKASTDSFNIVCRELVIPFGSSGYLALFEIQEEQLRVAVLAVKHQRESDYH